MTSQPSTQTIATDTIRVLGALREGAPLVHCMTNIVVAGFTANVLLAIGASPAMVENAEESADFAKIAGALLVNLGTLSPDKVSAMRLAAAAANGSGTPWVLDPVAVGALAYRTYLAPVLLSDSPTIIRGNASEILSLAGVANSAGRGVDSTADSKSALESASDFARRQGTVIAVSGAIDFITDGTRIIEVSNGDPIMTKVTGVGCALGALMAACAAVEPSPLVAAVAATTILTVAAEVAVKESRGPGSFAVSLLDALYTIDALTIEKHVSARH